MSKYFQTIKGADYKASVVKYVTGFGLSLMLTISAYKIVQIHLNNHHTSPSDQNLLYILAVLAVSQLFVQLIYFLHLNREAKPRMKLMIMLFAGLVVLIIVGGSMWIMTNLNYHMPASQSDQSIIMDEKVHP